MPLYIYYCLSFVAERLLILQQNYMSEAQEGDPKYMAPELMQGIFTKSADIFRSIFLFFCILEIPENPLD